MSSPPSSPDGWFGLKASQPAALRLVKGPDATPCEAEPFPFWLAVVIATVVLAAGAVGARFWLIPALLVEHESLPAPSVQIRNAGHWEADLAPAARVARLTPAQPSAPRTSVAVPIPAVQPEELVRPEWERPPGEPYDPTESLDEADLPFPTAREEPKVAKSPPKKSAPKTSRRPDSRPASAPKPVAEGKSSPAQVLRRYNPPYPNSARRDRTEGRVVLTVQVRSDGRVGSVRVASSSGSAVLDSAAISAVKRWSFAPEIENGRPVGTTLNVPFRFQLE